MSLLIDWLLCLVLNIEKSGDSFSEAQLRSNHTTTPDEGTGDEDDDDDMRIFDHCPPQI